MKLTKSIQEDLCRMLAGGEYIETAAWEVGIHPNTVHNWIRKGQESFDNGDKNGKYYDFLFACKRAMAQAERNFLLLVLTGNPGWQSKAWWLERKHKDRWGLKEKLEVTGKDGTPLLAREVDTLSQSALLKEWKSRHKKQKPKKK